MDKKTLSYEEHVAQCPENHSGLITKEGRPQLPDFKERAGAEGADIRRVFEEAAAYHLGRGSHAEWTNSDTFRWFQHRLGGKP